MRRLYLAPFCFYLAALALGVALRLFFVRPFGGIDFGHAVHAHSHTLYFGWAGLGLAALAFARIGATDRTVRRWLHALAWVSVATFFAFLHGGYGPAGMAVSTAALLIWGALAWLFFARARGQRGPEVAFLRVGMAYLALACVAAWGRVGLLVAGVHDPLYGKLAVFAFLHDFAWFFVFCLFALLAWLAPRLGTRLDPRLLRLQLLLTAPLAWLTFPLGVPGGHEGWLGLVAGSAAVGLLVPAAIGGWNLWRAARPAPRWTAAAFRLLALFFWAQAAMEAAGAFGLAPLALQSRHLAMLYLHVLLLGFVSLGLGVCLLAALGRRPGAEVAWHGGGTILLSTGLGLAGLPIFGLPAFAAPGLQLAVLGGLAVCVGAVGFTRSAWRPADPIGEPLRAPA